MAIRQLLDLDNSGYENYRTNFYLYGLHFKQILRSVTTLMDTPKSMRILSGYLQFDSLPRQEIFSAPLHPDLLWGKPSLV
jgi:hypothetical protein